MRRWIAIVAACWTTALSSAAAGEIAGVVLNGTESHVAVPGAEVVLRAMVGDSLVVAAETTADERGCFRFENLATSSTAVYLPGANYKGIHYPGRRVRFSGGQTVTHETITVYEPVTEPSPLVATSHDIDVRAETGVLIVTETIIVANPTWRTYVGSESTSPSAATLRLSIPSDFAKVTFDQEFFGRQFQLRDGCLETQVPWTPGQRELKFTYHLPFDSLHLIVHRALDLPTTRARVSVPREAIGRVACNLAEDPVADDAHAVFTSDGATLPRGFDLRIELGNLPVPWAHRARWGAVALLLALVLAATFAMRRRSPRSERQLDESRRTCTASRAPRVAQKNAQP
jgi:hypothetical protein